MPRDEPNITKKIPVLKVTYKGVSRRNKKLYEKETFLYGDYDNQQEELESIRKNVDPKTDIVLMILKEEPGLATVTMTIDTFLANAKIKNEKENQK